MSAITAKNRVLEISKKRVPIRIPCPEQSIMGSYMPIARKGRASFLLSIDLQESAVINYPKELAISLFASVFRLSLCPGFIVSFVNPERNLRTKRSALARWPTTPPTHPLWLITVRGKSHPNLSEPRAIFILRRLFMTDADASGSPFLFSKRFKANVLLNG